MKAMAVLLMYDAAAPLTNIELHVRCLHTVNWRPKERSSLSSYGQPSYLLSVLMYAWTAFVLRIQPYEGESTNTRLVIGSQSADPESKDDAPLHSSTYSSRTEHVVLCWV